MDELQLQSDQLDALDGQGDAADSQTDPAEAPGADGTATYDLDGDRYTADDLRQWKQAAENRRQWQASYTQRDQKFAAIRKAFEDAHGKPLDQFGENDLADIAAYGVFNNRLRSDPNYAQDWANSLRHTVRLRDDPSYAQQWRQWYAGQFRAQGATPQQAQTAARQVVQQQQAATIAPELQQRLDALERSQVEATLSTLEAHVGDTVDRAVSTATGGNDAWMPLIQRHVLYELSKYTDGELLGKARDGSLGPEVAELAGQAADGIKRHLSRADADRTKRLVAAKGAAATAPFRGGVAGQAPSGIVPERGRGLSKMTERLFQDVAS